MGQSQGQGPELGQLLPPSSSSSPAILVKTHCKSEHKLDGAVPSTPDSVESLITKFDDLMLDDAVKPVGRDSSETGEAPSILSSTADVVVESFNAKLEHKSDGDDDICWGERRWGAVGWDYSSETGKAPSILSSTADVVVESLNSKLEHKLDGDDDICWGERRWGVKPTWWDHDVKPTGWEDEERSDQDVKPTGWEDEERSNQDVKPTGREDEERSFEDVKPTGWEDEERSYQDVKPTGWEDEERSEKALLPNDINCEKGKYPERPDRTDCSFYVNTGSCKFGLNCRFNHPPHRNKGYKGKSKKGSESTQIGVCKVPPVLNTEERVLDLSASAEAYQQSKTPKQMEKQEGKSEGNGCDDYPRPEGNSNPVELMSSKEGKSEAICFPQRADKPDCSYYLKTGKCQFGSNCKFNHPSRGKVTTKNQSERIKSSVSGGNKVGTTGKHAHFPVKTEPGPEELNFLGLPMRPGEMECTHFMRTGSCKFATNCRYHHPNPVAVTEQDTLSGYQNGASPRQHASGASELPMTSFSLPIASCGPLPRPSSPYAPGFYALPTEGFYPCPGWSGYQVPTTPWIPPEMISGNPLASNMRPQIDEYPERPGQPVCHYFTKYGHCKFKSACKFHHPKMVHTAPIH